MIAVLDLETTGLDPAAGGILEAAVALVDTRPGEPWTVLDTCDFLNDPGCDIPEEVTELTGLTRADVAGRRLREDIVFGMLDQAELVVAHHAAFDRGWLERHLQPQRPYRWACSVEMIDWAAHRQRCRQLRHLAFEHEIIRPGHRALADVFTLVDLLRSRDRVPARGARTYGEELLEAAAARWAVVYATSAPFDRKDVLREAGWRWAGGRKVWWRTVRADGLDALGEWLGANVYGGRAVHRAELDVDFLRPDFQEAYGLR